MIRYFCWFAIIMMCAAVCCQATLVEFSDKASFLSATGATSASGAYPNLHSSAHPSVTLGDVTITTASGTLFVGRSGGDWSTLIAGNDIAISGREHLDLDFADPIFSLGYQVHDPGSVSVFNVTLKLGGTTVDSFGYSSGSSLDFIGITSDQAFDRVEIRETSGGVEDEYFGEFFISTTNSTVPEPSSLALVILGLVVGFFHRHKVKR